MNNAIRRCNMADNNYMLVTRPENWDRLKDDPAKIWPVKLRNAMIFKKFNIGDKLLVYVSQVGAITGVVEVREAIQSIVKPMLFMGDFYECVLPVEYKAVLEGEKRIIIKTLIDKLDLTKENNKSWGSALQRAIVKLTEEDFNLLLTQVQNKSQQIRESVDW